MKVTRTDSPTAIDGRVENRDRVRRSDPLMEVSKRFEAVFVNQMVSAMGKTVIRDGFLPESQAEKVYRSMLDYEHSQRIADSGQIGLSKMIYDHLLRTQFRR